MFPYQSVTPFSCLLSSVEEIVEAIQAFDGLQALRLEGNTIGVEAAKTIAKALETKSEIKVFRGPIQPRRQNNHLPNK